MNKLLRNLRRYHYSVYFPENTPDMLLNFFDQLNEINLTYHAVNQMCDDPRGVIDLPVKEDLLKEDNLLVEFYENCDCNNNPIGEIQKVLLRIKHFNSELDYTYLIAKEGYIVSAWCNQKSDVHRLTSSSLKEYFKPNNEKIAA